MNHARSRTINLRIDKHLSNRSTPRSIFYEIFCYQWPVFSAWTELKASVGKDSMVQFEPDALTPFSHLAPTPLEDKWNKISTLPSIFSQFYLFPTWDLSIDVHILVLTTSFRKYIYISFTFRLELNGWTDFFHKLELKMKYFFSKKYIKHFFNMNSFFDVTSLSCLIFWTRVFFVTE